MDRKLILFVTIILACFLFSQRCTAQINYAEIPIKEEFDAYNAILTQVNYIPCSISPNNDQDTYGDGMYYVLDSYITMYKTTHDLAYLNKFVIESICMMANRHDYAGVNFEPRWSQHMYHDGNIIGSLSSFVYLIKYEEPNLQQTNIYPFPQVTANPFGQTFNTYLQYANWLGVQVGTTLDWFVANGYWDNALGFTTQPNENSAAAINMQVGFGRALLYMGLSDPNLYYQQQAQTIANLFKSVVTFYDPCEDVFYSEPVLHLNSNNSYWWYHSGWSVQLQNCFDPTPPAFYFGVPSYVQYIEYKEDMSHGAGVVILPLVYYGVQPNSPFTTTDMIRFRNTFAKNVYDGVDEYYNAVDGTDNPVFSNACTNCPHNVHSMQALRFMPYQAFDGADNTASAPNIYTILMEFYFYNIYNLSSLPVNYGGATNNGHAQTVQAQWANECVNVTFYNRDLVYNQDFYIKNRLSILPEASTPHHQPGDPSYADPIISTDIFSIEPNVTSNMTAGEEIILGPGFIAKEGCTFNATISTTACTDGQRVAAPQEQPQIYYVHETAPVVVSTPVVLTPHLSVVPNPSSGETTLQFSLQESGNVSLVITDVLGRVVFSEMNDVFSESGNYVVPVALTNETPGIYICNLSIDGVLVDVTRIVVK